jgi:hypothetical protein
MSGTCQEPSCDDGVENGGESDIDCGAQLCPCDIGDTCENDNNCTSGLCDQMVCVLDHCVDEQRDIDLGESDIDCGGDCAGCDPGEMCGSDNGNCKSKVCGPDQTCLEATCDDHTMNGDETDVDCGGSDECGRCDAGEMCDDASDCKEHVCVDGECAEPTCDDDVDNGNETDVDCGGDDCDPCAAQHGCELDRDCESNICLGICVEATCSDGQPNNNEVDTDCGGDCALCGLDMKCNEDSDCASNSCGAGGSCQIGLRLEQGCTLCDATSTSALGFQIALSNLSDSEFPLGEAVVRYYFSSSYDGNFDVSCYGCPHTINVKDYPGSNTEATHFVELDFADTTEALPADPTQTVNVLVTVTPHDGAEMDQTDDYSFVPSFAQTSRTTVHRDGVLIWGTEPPVD